MINSIGKKIVEGNKIELKKTELNEWCVADMYQMMDGGGCHGSEVGHSFQGASRTYQDSKEDMVMTDLSAGEATAGRDGLCKALYYRLFTWIINNINERIKVNAVIIIHLKK